MKIRTDDIFIGDDNKIHLVELIKWSNNTMAYMYRLSDGSKFGPYNVNSINPEFGWIKLDKANHLMKLLL